MKTITFIFNNQSREQSQTHRVDRETKRYVFLTVERNLAKYIYRISKTTGSLKIQKTGNNGYSFDSGRVLILSITN